MDYEWLEYLLLHRTENLGVIKSYQKELDKKPVTKDSTFIEEAARHGCLDILKYLHERGSNLTEECSENAASNGHMDCLRYCHENGCPFSEDSILQKEDI